MKRTGRPPKERYARLMGGFWRNPKVRALSSDAIAALVKAWSYAADNMTDGRIPLELLAGWGGKRHRAIMVELTRGSDAPGDRPFLSIDGIDAVAHDFVEINISRSEWEEHLERERGRKRKKGGSFPGGNPGGNGGDFPGGNPPERPPDFRAAALDEDEDERSIHDRSRGSDRVGRATPATVPEPPRVVEDRGIGRFAEIAYDAAIRASGGAYACRDGDAAAFRTVADAANALRGERPLAEVLAELATAYVAERQRHRPQWFAEWAQERAARGSRPRTHTKARGNAYEPPAPHAAFAGAGTLEEQIEQRFGARGTE